MRKSIALFLSPYQGFSKSTWKLISAGFVNSIGSIITIYLSLYLNALNFSVNTIGIVITLFGVGGLLGSYIGGYITERYSALKVCKVSLITNALLLLLLPFSKQIYFISTISFLTGFSNNTFRPAFILALTHEEKIGQMNMLIALRRVAINLGVAFGAAICGLLAAINYDVLFWFNALVNIVAFVILIGVSDSIATIPITACEKIKINTGSANNAIPYFLLVTLFFILLVYEQGNAAYPIYLTNNLGLNIHLVSYLFGLNGLVIALFQMPVSKVLSKYNDNITCSIGAVFIGLGFSILPFCYNSFFVFLSCVIWTLGEIMLFPAIMSLLLNLSEKEKGRNVGLYQLITSLSLLISPSLGLYIYSYNNNLIWYLSAAIEIIVSLMFLVPLTTSSENKTVSITFKKAGNIQ